jgi:hypothetical protein
MRITDLDGDGLSDFILAGRRSSNAVFYHQLPTSKNRRP